jgi:PPK2 family polyphosphate:nucleotide phosphotransferase
MAKSRMSKLIDRYIVRDGKNFRLKDIDPGDTGGFKTDKAAAEGILKEGVERLCDLQEKLYAQDRWGVLLVFQAMDAAGKDGAIKHVMSGINPQGCQVYSFKQPSSTDLDHDFLWRNLICLPERGRIGIFNRSYYEEVLVVRVHPELLSKQQIPSELVTKHIWKERYEDINALERYLGRNGYVIRKFFLHLGKKEQAKRFEKRLDEADKQWKFSLGDLHERERWKDYQDAYEDTIRHTATSHAPWIVVPANKKWFARWVVAATVIDALDELNLAYPKVTPAKRIELQKGRRLLRAAARKS